MGIRASRINIIPDYAGNITLRELANGADTSLGYNHAGTVEIQRATPRWQTAQPLEQSFVIEGVVGEISNTSGDATFVLEISSSVTSGGARTTLTTLTLTAVTEFTLNVDNNQLSDNANFLHVGMTITGNLPHRILWSAQMRSNPSNPSSQKGK